MAVKNKASGSPRKSKQVLGQSPKEEPTMGLGHHQCRACLGMAVGRCECIFRRTAYGGWPEKRPLEKNDFPEKKR